MDKTKLGLAAAISTLALGSVGAASAAPIEAQPIPPAASYADLLDPVPNAAERLAVVQAQGEADGARLIKVQYEQGQMAHHHHNNYSAPMAHHHHNNYYSGQSAHHHNNYYSGQAHHHHSYYNRRHWHRRHYVRHYYHHHHHHHNSY